MIRSLKDTHSSLKKVQELASESLSSINSINKDRYHSVLFSLPEYQEIFVHEDDDGVISAIASVFIETKIIHGGANECHVHDLVVKDNNPVIVKDMVDHISLYAKEKCCKEIIWITNMKLETGIANAPIETCDIKVSKIRLSN